MSFLGALKICMSLLHLLLSHYILSCIFLSCYQYLYLQSQKKTRILSLKIGWMKCPIQCSRRKIILCSQEILLSTFKNQLWERPFILITIIVRFQQSIYPTPQIRRYNHAIMKGKKERKCKRGDEEEEEEDQLSSPSRTKNNSFHLMVQI